MTLAPEVQAAMVKVAGDWAIRVTRIDKTATSRERVLASIKDNFEGAYAYLINIIGEHQ